MRNDSLILLSDTPHGTFDCLSLYTYIPIVTPTTICDSLNMVIHILTHIGARYLNDLIA